MASTGMLFSARSDDSIRWSGMLFSVHSDDGICLRCVWPVWFVRSRQGFLPILTIGFAWCVWSGQICWFLSIPTIAFFLSAWTLWFVRSREGFFSIPTIWFCLILYDLYDSYGLDWVFYPIPTALFVWSVLSACSRVIYLLSLQASREVAERHYATW